MIQERAYSSGIFWKDYLFRAFEENVMFPCIFLRNIIFQFPPKETDHIFREKIFPDDTRNIIFRCDFIWKDQLFRTFGKTKYSFSCSVNHKNQVYQ